MPRRRRAAADPALDLERIDCRRAAAQDGRGPAHERPATRAYINRIAAVNARGPGLNAVRDHEPARAVRRVAARPRARHRPRARPAARHPGAGQGQPRRRRPADHGRQRRAPELDPGARLDRRGQAARGRRGDPRQDEPDRVRELHDQRHAERLLARSAARSSTRTTSTSARAARRAGSGSAAAAGLAAITIGTETSGSIVSPAAQQGVVGLRPTVGLVSRTGILPISRLAGHRRPDDPDRRRRRRRAAGDRRQGRRRTRPPTTRPPRSRTTSPGSPRPRWRASGSASSTTPTRSTWPRSRRSRRSARRRCRSRRRARPQNFSDILTAEFKRDLNAYLVAAARERADEVARRHHRLQHRARRRGAEVRPDAADREPGRRPQRPGAERRPTSPTATAAAPPPAPRSTTR